MKYNSKSACKERRALAKRARKIKCPIIIPFTKADVIKRDGWNCYLCGKLLTYETATIDYMLALSKGGWHCPDNAKIACFECNLKKDCKKPD